jgi:patatin-like phospholipase/acyl hydrolase
MRKIQKEKNLDEPPKPCEIFDLICGTSTGGIIALMLGRLQMTVEKAIDVYCNVSGRVFGKAKRRISEGKFSATELENVMQETIVKFGKPKDVNGKADPEMKLLETQGTTNGCKV